MVEKKVWAEPDFDSAYFGGSKNPHGGKKSMGRTRLRLSLFWWIEKSTRWKKKYGPNQTSTQPILVDRKIHTVEKKVWAEPDFDSAYFGGSKNPHGGKKSMGRTRLRLSLFWWIEKSTLWKKKYGPNQTSTQPILVDRKIHTVEKKVWAEPDFDSAYFGGSKKKNNTLQSKWEYYRMWNFGIAQNLFPVVKIT